MHDVHRRLGELGAATVHEVVGPDSACGPELRAVWQDAIVAGPALTVEGHPGDNLALHQALEAAEPGQVLVVALGGHLAGYWGEVLTVAAMERGVQGLVIDGGVRDTREIESLGFPVFARGTALRGTGKHHDGRLGKGVVVAGVHVHAGDVVVGDRDGVTVVPRDSVADVLERAEARVAKEADFMERLRAGATTVELLGLASAKGQ